MVDLEYSGRLQRYWGRDNLAQEILGALTAADMDLESLTVDDLAPLDQFHGGGLKMTERLAHLADLKPGTRVLDAGGGLGGPARTLAFKFGCRVTMLDMTESYVQAAHMLNRMLELEEVATAHVADALELPFEDKAFDVVWTQNSGMNIDDKQRLYQGFQRVLRPGGRLVLQEPMAGPRRPLIFPVMWARDERTNFLRTPEEMGKVIEAAGFRLRAWENVKKKRAPDGASAPVTVQSIQSLVMGDEIAAIREAARRNSAEGRWVMVQAVFDRL